MIPDTVCRCPSCTSMIPDSLIEACARAAHEANRAYCIAMGDHSQPAWEDAPEWQRSSARNGVRGALAGNTPEQSHEGWLAEKLANGWKYGPVKNPDAKEHPCMVPYAELPPEQRAKDHIFTSVVRALGKALTANDAAPVEAVVGVVSHAQNPSVLRRARDFYATYCASSDGKNYQGLPCPAWDALTPAVRGHWYTVALRSLQLEAISDPEGAMNGLSTLGNERANVPNDYVLGHLTDPQHARGVWSEYSGIA